MYKKPAGSHQASTFGDLESMLNQRHPLYNLANLVDWDVFESAFKKLYCSNNGKPPKPIRLMSGPLMLQHIHNISDESSAKQISTH